MSDDHTLTAPLGWISTRDALPPIGGEFLAVVAGRVTTAVRTERDRWAHRIDTGTETFQISMGRPTLWMPLPELPMSGL